MDRPTIKQRIFALQPGDVVRFPNTDDKLAQYVRAQAAGRGLSVSVTQDEIKVGTEQRTSFADELRDKLRNYAEPFAIEGKSEAYLRGLVSKWNSYGAPTGSPEMSVIRHGGKLWVCTRSDRRNIKETAPVAPYTGTETPEELLKRAVELMRSAGLGGDEMRTALNQYITDNDDLL